MKTVIAVLIVAAGLASCELTAEDGVPSASLAEASVGRPTVHMGPPPPHVRRTGSIHDPDATLRLDDWILGVEIDPHQQALVLGHRPVDLDFWPTCVLGLSRERLLVCGKADERGDHATRIEVWTFDRAEPALVPPSALIRSRHLVFEESSARRDMVALAVENQAAPNRCFVQFHGSGDLYDIALDGRRPPRLLLTTDLAVASGTGIPAELGLDLPYDRLDPANHRELGHVYIFRSRDPNGGSTDAALVLIDRDRDGELEIDATVFMEGTPEGRQLWFDLGLGEASMFED